MRSIVILFCLLFSSFAIAQTSEPVSQSVSQPTTKTEVEKKDAKTLFILTPLIGATILNGTTSVRVSQQGQFIRNEEFAILQAGPTAGMRIGASVAKYRLTLEGLVFGNDQPTVRLKNAEASLLLGRELTPHVLLGAGAVLRGFNGREESDISDVRWDVGGLFQVLVPLSLRNVELEFFGNASVARARPLVESDFAPGFPVSSIGPLFATSIGLGFPIGQFFKK